MTGMTGMTGMAGWRGGGGGPIGIFSTFKTGGVVSILLQPIIFTNSYMPLCSAAATSDRHTVRHEGPGATATSPTDTPHTPRGPRRGRDLSRLRTPTDTRCPLRHSRDLSDRAPGRRTPHAYRCWPPTIQASAEQCCPGHRPCGRAPQAAYFIGPKGVWVRPTVERWGVIGNP